MSDDFNVIALLVGVVIGWPLGAILTQLAINAIEDRKWRRRGNS